ncbi:hypothetical protein OPU71_10760 [Niveibacterium sp. 24ML]|uniref:hypothetical protein n=1 Tax=Niveibacterium sp. 24ML TaxID=2985512 RepID=UPI00226DA6F6|nr:hypothetical protein [Niveibacterium sp. 24ML]MCX9156602.1 hypothetical protein [Niveibacterium sp. 24ML]
MLSVKPLNRRQNHIPELAQTHAEELAYLWHRRRHSLRSTELTTRAFAELNERIEAHLQGLLITGDALAEIAAPSLLSEDRDEVFAGAWPMLRSGSANAARTILEAFAAASGERLLGLRDALGMASPLHTEATLRAALTHGQSHHAAAAAVVLATQRRLEPTHPRLATLLDEADPAIASQAWRAVLQIDQQSEPIPRPYAAAIAHSDAQLRAAALEAGVWRGESWVPRVIKQLAESGDSIGLDWTAATLQRELDDQGIHALLALQGKKRFALLARAGHPAAFEPLLIAIQDPDAACAAAAGLAWARITGFDVEGERVALTPADDADDFARDFPEEVRLPDVQRAQQQWRDNAAQWQVGNRWCRGHDICRTLSSMAQKTIDLEARWDFGARAALAGTRVFSPPPAI